MTTTALSNNSPDFKALIDDLEFNHFQDDIGYLSTDDLEESIKDDICSEHFKTHDILETLNDNYQVGKELLEHGLSLALDIKNHNNDESLLDRYESFFEDLRQMALHEALKAAEICKEPEYIGRGEQPTAAWHYGH